MSGNKAYCPQWEETTCQLLPEHPCPCAYGHPRRCQQPAGCPCASWVHSAQSVPITILSEFLHSLCHWSLKDCPFNQTGSCFQRQRVYLVLNVFLGCLAQGKSSSTNTIPWDYFTSNRRRIFMCLEQNAHSKHTFLWGMSSKEAW